jgi:protein tyrosine phosphatase (PTP) superfamily phosphohydrolase (DUF442 family)
MSSSLADIYNYRLISEGLATSGQPKEAQLADIAAAGYAVVINLALHDDPRYSLPDERKSVTDLHMAYVHIPVKFDAPTDRDLAAFFDAMEANADRRLWVHCAANIRVTAFLGLYRALRQGWDIGQAFEPMNSVWKPNAVWSDFIADQLKQGAARQPRGNSGR